MALRLRSTSTPPAGLPRDEYAELAELWVEGLNRPHDSNCACAGMMATFEPGDVERDALGYIMGKYRLAGEHEAADFVQARRESGEGGRFESWLADLGKAPLPEDKLEKLTADLRDFLESFAGKGQSRFGVCY